MPIEIVAASGADRQPPHAPSPRVVGHLQDDTVRLLARCLYTARWLNHVDRVAPVFEALSVEEQRALEREATRFIRQGDPIATSVALHRAAVATGLTRERLAEAMAWYDGHLEGL